MKKVGKSLALWLSLVWSTHASAGVVENEIIILLDSSGSLFDTGFSTWNAMLDYAENLVQTTEAGNAHDVGIVAGCNSSTTLTECADPDRQSRNEGFLNMHHGLHDDAIDPYSGRVIPGDQAAGAVTTFVMDLDESDFTFGFSWHDEALAMALISFEASSNTVNGSREVFFLTDGQGATLGHSPVGENGAISDTLQSLRDADIRLNVVNFGSSPDLNYLTALTGSLNNVTNGFGTLHVDRLVNVPAPATIALFALGLLALMIRRRR